jgi:hypothetical protein
LQGLFSLSPPAQDHQIIRIGHDARAEAFLQPTPWALHPLENAAFARRIPIAIDRERQRRGNQGLARADGLNSAQGTRAGRRLGLDPRISSPLVAD